MANSNNMLAVGLAAATLIAFVVVIALGGALRAGLAPWPGIGVAVLAIASFAASRGRRSLVVAGLLGVGGVVGVVYGLIRTDFLMESTFAGPIFRIIVGLPILGLAVAEAIGAIRGRRSGGDDLRLRIRPSRRARARIGIRLAVGLWVGGDGTPNTRRQAELNLKKIRARPRGFANHGQSGSDGLKRARMLRAS